MTTALYIIGSLYLLWLGYVFTMHVKAQWDVMHWSAKVLGAPPAVLAYLLDLLVNLIPATMLFMDLPREATLTKRLHRYQQGRHRYTWRHKIAAFVCQRLLNPFDPDHC